MHVISYSIATRFVAGLFFAVAPFAGSGVEALAAEAPSESQQRLLGDLKYLSDDARQGRGVGTDGINQAADFVRREFEKAGLDVTTVGGGAFQTFEMTTGAELGKPNVLTLTGPSGESLELKYDEDYRTCAFGDSGKFSGEVVFCGYGIDAEDEKYQEYKGVDVKGKVVVVMRRVPRQGKKDGAFEGPHGGMSRHAELRTKVSHAFGNEAAAILLVNDPYSAREARRKAVEQLKKSAQKLTDAATAVLEADAKEDKAVAEAKKQLDDALASVDASQKRLANLDADPLMKFGYGGSGESRHIPIFHIKQAVCNKMLAASMGKSLADVEREIDAELKPQTAVLEGWTASGETSVRQLKSEVKNVIGVLEGKGPLADETVVIGAHYDHVGLGGRGSLKPGSKEVHNGADDNASGTVALVELARRLAARKEPPARRLVFIAFTGEELGLIGSARYVKEPVFPLENTIAMYNMDMVGRLTDDKLTVFGSGTAARFKPMLEELAKEYNFKLTLKPSGFGPSDHSSFYAKKIPVLHFFTGTHGDYHRPTDDWEKINVEGLNRIVDAIEEVVDATVQNKERPKYVEVKGRATIGRSGNRPYFGSIPDFANNVEGYALTGVASDSPAAKGGLQGGDVITGFGGQKIGNLSDFDLALRKFSAGDEVEVVVLRDGKDVKLTVTLGKPK